MIWTMHKQLESKNAKLEAERRSNHAGAFRKLILTTALFLNYLLTALVNAFILLFSHPSKSFSALYQANPNGTFKHSYSQHVYYRRNLRIFSFSTFFTIVVASFSVQIFLDYFFPPTSVRFANAAAVTVTNANDSGAGSFRQAILDVNASSDSTNTISIDLTGNLPQTLTLVAALPPVTKPVVLTNADSQLSLVVKGDALGSSEACMTLSSGSDGSAVSGLGFQNCPTAIAIATNSITLGSSGTGQIYITGGATGIDVLASVSSTTIQNVIAGRWTDNTGSGMTDAFKIQGTNNTLTNVEAVNSTYGITLSGNTNIVTTSYIGMNSSSTDMGNITAGVYVTGNSNTVGGSTADTANYIGYNNWGIYITGSASSNVVSINYIGYKTDRTTAAPNDQHGITVRSAVNNNILGIASPVQAPVIGKNTQNGIDIRSANVTVNKAQVSGNSGMGFYVEGGSATTLTIDGAQVTNNTSYGIGLSGTVATIKNSTVTGNGADGINSSNTTGTMTIGGSSQGNTSSSNGQKGISIFNHTGALTIQGNTVQSNLQDGIILNGMSGSSSTATISDNTSSSNTNEGIELSGVVGTYTVSGNTVNQNAGYGISLGSSSTASGTMSSNTLSGNTSSYALAILEGTSGTHTLSGNTITHNGDYGIFVYNPNDQAVLTLSGNTITTSTGTGTEGIHVSTASNDTISSDITISNNTISNMPGNGVNVHDADGFVLSNNTITNTGNTSSGGDANVYLLRVSNFTIQNNTFTKTGTYYQQRDCMVLAGPGSGNVITGNTMDGCYSGIQITQAITASEVGGTVSERNTFRNNQTAVSVNNATGYSDTKQVLVSANTFEDNTNNITLLAGSNAGATAPTVSATDSTVSAITGTGAFNGGTVQVYASPDGTDIYFFGEATAAADGSFTLDDVDYDFTVLTAVLDIAEVSEMDGYYLSALNIDSSNNTSAFGATTQIDYVAPVAEDDDTSTNTDNNEEEVSSEDGKNTKVNGIRIKSFQDRNVTFFTNGDQHMLVEGEAGAGSIVSIILESKTSVQAFVQADDKNKIEVQEVVDENGNFEIKVALPAAHADQEWKFFLKKQDKARARAFVFRVRKDDLSLYPEDREVVFDDDDEDTVVFGGAGTPEATIALIIDKLSHGDTTVSGDGAWEKQSDILKNDGHTWWPIQTTDERVRFGLKKSIITASEIAKNSIEIKQYSDRLVTDPNTFLVNQSLTLYGVAPRGKKQLFVDGTQVAESLTNALSYSFVLSDGLSAGAHRVQIKVVDKNGSQTWSDRVYTLVGYAPYPAAHVAGFIKNDDDHTLVIYMKSGAYYSVEINGQEFVSGQARVSASGTTTVYLDLESYRGNGDQAIFVATQKVPGEPATTVNTFFAIEELTPVTGDIPGGDGDTGYTGDDNSNEGDEGDGGDNSGNTNTNTNTNVDGNVNENANSNTNASVDSNTNNNGSLNTNVLDNVNSTVSGGVNENTNTAENTNASTEEFVKIGDQEDVTPENIDAIEDAFEKEASKNGVPAYAPATEKKVDITPKEKKAVEETLTDSINDSTSAGITFNNEVLPAQVSNGTVTIDIPQVVDAGDVFSELIGGTSVEEESGNLTFSGIINMSALPEIIRDLPLLIELTLSPGNFVQIAEAAETGEWTITVPLNLLSQGEHVAWLGAEVNGVQSDQIQISRFVIQEKPKLSSTTVLILVNIFVAIIILLILIAIELHKNRKYLEDKNNQPPSDPPSVSGGAPPSASPPSVPSSQIPLNLPQ